MVLLILAAIGIRAGPDGLVGNPVEVIVGSNTASDFHAQRFRSIEAAEVIIIWSARIIYT